jgi:hypothetical protein
MAKRKDLAAEQATSTAEADPTFDPKEIDSSAEKKPFNPVRGWSSRNVQPVSYERLTDANMFVNGASQRGAIVFKFKLPKGQYKPDPEVLKVMDEHKRGYQDKPTGLKFMQTREHGNAWVIPNDVEGRTLADKIEQGLKKVAEKLEAEGRGR